MGKAKNLLNIAEGDLTAAVHLCENESFPQAVFYLEQSIEKTAKAFGLEVGIIEEGTLQRLGHHHEKIFELIQDKTLKFLSDIIPESLLRITDLYAKQGWDNLNINNPDVFNKQEAKVWIAKLENLDTEGEMYPITAIRILHLLVPWPYAIIPRYPTGWGDPLNLPEKNPIPLHFFEQLSKHTRMVITRMKTVIDQHTFRNLFRGDL